MYQAGFGIEFVDVGGGLGIDYDGSRSTQSGSVNYSIQEYANDVIYSITEAATNNGIPHPNVIAESGRALTAHHSLLVFNVLETSQNPTWDPDLHKLPENPAAPLKELHRILSNLNQRNMMESWR